MIWFLSILAGLLFLIILLLWLPLQIEIATEKEIYEAKWSGLLRFRAVPADEKWRWFIRVLFWEMELGRDQARVETERKPEPQKPKKEKRILFHTTGDPDRQRHVIRYPGQTIPDRLGFR